MGDPGDSPLAEKGRAGPPGPGAAWRLLFLFGALAFFQGVNDPTEGLVAQPVRSLQKARGRTASEITAFSALVAVPWLLKPIFGLISDFIPFAGTRRKAYLVAASAILAAVYLGLFLSPAIASAVGPELLAWLTVATAAVAFGDVAADALLVERGQEMGMTGRFQSVQWASLYASGIVVGMTGGRLSGRHHERWAFLFCALAAAATLAFSIRFVREPAFPVQKTSLQGGGRLLVRTICSPMVAGIGAFLFLWNFNPFSTAVLYLHMTRGLGFSEDFYGQLISLGAATSIVASLAYAVVCRRVAVRSLVHASIVLGVVANLAYVVMIDRWTATLVTMGAGFAYMTATLIQLDLAARGCPRVLAGTVFAMLMALENLAGNLSTWLGGIIYEHGLGRWGGETSFRVLVVIGAGLTACCWLIVPVLRADLLADRGAPVASDRSTGSEK